MTKGVKRSGPASAAKYDTSTELGPDWSIHPGQILAGVLEDRGIRQSELAERTGMSAKHVNQLVTKSIGITGDTAVLLERALDIPALTWLQAQADWDLWMSRQRASEASMSYLEWASGFDRATLEHHNVVDSRDEMEVVVEKLLRFFGVSSPAAFEETWIRPRVSFRRAQKFTVREQNTALWLRLVDRAASRQKVADFRPKALHKAARQLPALTQFPVVDGFLAARQVLAEVGVALVFVREVDETRLCGATWWLDARRPTIAVTERYKRTDSFWFNIMHEVGHVALHPKRETFVNIEKDKSVNDSAEAEANEYARNALIGDALPQIVAAHTRDDFVRVARQLGIGVSIVAGQHANATKNYGGVAGRLRGTIGPDDVRALEEESGSLEP
jgi:HTH-type transcriptional regulator/antitoxin HigA